MTDKNRLVQVAREFSRCLEPFGLSHSQQFRPEKAEHDGWWAKVASWRSERVNVGVFYDTWLGRDTFWFGFYAEIAHIKQLMAKIPNSMGQFIEIQPSDWNGKSLSPNVYRKFKETRLWVYENWPLQKQISYFGIYESSKFLSDPRTFVADAASIVGAVVAYIDPSLAERRDIHRIKSEVDDETERKALISARRGQGKFRDSLLARWGGCAVTQLSIPGLLRASHIKAWCRSNNKERLDVDNGLLLNSLLDSLFDRGLISFNDMGAMMVGKNVDQDQLELVSIIPRECHLSKPLSTNQKRYLKHHRLIHGFQA